MNSKDNHPLSLLKLLAFYSRLAYPVALILITISFGTLGYRLIEGWSFVDALFMTITTMTTVGYGEIHPLSHSGRMFTIGLIITSIGLAGYVVSRLTAFIVEGEIKQILQGRKMDKQIAELTKHVILCGAGQTGLHIAEELSRTHTPFVVIEQEQEAINDLARLGGKVLYLKEDATRDETLLLAGIKRAKGLFTTLSEDKENIFVTLCARSLNPQLRIVARVIEDQNAELLRRAGADEIVSPNAIGGIRMASIMLRPTVVAFLDEMLRVTGQTLRLEEMHVDDFPGLLNRSLGQAGMRRKTGLLVVAIKSGEGYQFNPGADTMLRSGDILIVIGTEEQLQGLSLSGK